MSSEGGTIGGSAGSRAEPSSRAEPEASGWVLFAGVMILIAGTMNLIYGIAAIAESSFYVSNTRFVFSDLKTIIGAIECTAALGIWARQPWARWTGVTIATLNGVAQLLFIAAFPLLSLAVFTLDVLVIYGLIAHGGESEGA
jgi:hypothetical protein